MTILDCATDRLCRGGTAVKNLAYSASFYAAEKSAPPNPGGQTPSIRYMATNAVALNRQQERARTERFAQLVRVFETYLGMNASA